MNKHAPLEDETQTAVAGAAGGESAYRYWAFLSYSHADSQIADRLHKQLEKFRVPDSLVGKPHPLGTIPEYVKPIFRDRHELAAASSLSREIDEALVESRYLIVLCSPAAASSRWVNDEVRRFKQLHGEDRVLAAIVEGEPFSEEEECFPPALRFRVGKNGKLTKDKVEPIAADLRDDRDGPRIGALKIAAGMLEVGLDDLVQRDQQRRNRRARWIVAASLAGMVFTTGLSVVAINARDAARDQRREAEGLVSFMLGDLREELEPIGRLDALDQVGARALAYYERQTKDDLSDDQLAQRSKALTMLGEIAMDRVDLKAAEARYREAMNGTAVLVQRDPDNPERLFDHAQNVFYVGELAHNRGDLDLAEKSFVEYRRLADQMVALAPAEAKYRLEQKYALTNLGVVLYERQRYAAASQIFAAALTSLNDMIRREPGSLDLQKSKVETLAWLADSRNGEWRADQALKIRVEGKRLLDDLIRRHPRDVSLAEKSAPWMRAIARLQTSSGNLIAGIAALQEGIGSADRLLANEPGNMVWSQHASNLRLDMARIYIDRGRTGDASAEIARACTNRVVTGTDAAALEARRIAIRCLDTKARVALAQGNVPESLIMAGETLASARRYRSGDTTNDQIQIAEARKLVGDIMSASGNRSSARDAYRAGLAEWPKGEAESPRSAALRAALLRGSGRVAEAATITKQLHSIGYKIFY